jgi:hypothetical protein
VTQEGSAADGGRQAEKVSAASRGRRRGAPWRRQGARRAASEERVDRAEDVGSVPGGDGARAARRWIRSSRHLMRREIEVLVPSSWVRGD